jgi:hypothetical protein
MKNTQTMAAMPDRFLRPVRGRATEAKQLPGSFSHRLETLRGRGIFIFIIALLASSWLAAPTTTSAQTWTGAGWGSWWTPQAAWTNYQDANDASTNTAASDPSGTASPTDSTATNNDTTAVDPSATTSDGVDAASDTSDATVQPDSQTILPSMVTALMATDTSSSQVTLRWNSSADTGGLGLAGYLIFRNGVLVGTTTATTFVDTTVSPSTSYCYTVIAYDIGGNDALTSAEDCLTTSSASQGGGNPAPSGPGYYVDYVGGSDSAAGTNTATAWKHCPGDPSATGNAASATLKPGTTVYFKGGEDYVITAPNIGGGETAGISVNWSGTAGNPITYTSTSAWGVNTNRAVITDNYSPNNITAFYSANGFSNIVFNNLEIGPIAGGPNPSYTGTVTPGHGIDSGGSQANILVENCYFHNIGWFGCCGSGKSAGAGYEATDSSYVTITNCQFYAIPAAVDWLTTVGSSNLTIEGCLFQPDMNWTIYLPIVGGFRDAIYVHNNMFYDVDVTDAAWASCGIQCFHADTIMNQALPYGSGADVFTDGPNIDIYDNVFYDDTTVNAGETAILFLTGTTSANFYNNLCIQNNASDGLVYVNPDSESQTNFLVRVYNNTSYNNGVEFVNVYTDNSQPNGIQPGVFLPSEVVDMKNNICYNFASLPTLVLSATNSGAAAQWKMNNDDVFNSNGYGDYMYWGVNGYLTLSAMQSYGWETKGLTSNPMFLALTYPGYTSMGISNNYGLLASSPCIGAGTNLSGVNLPGLADDITGKPRTNYNGGWDLGAYQH